MPDPSINNNLQGSHKQHLNYANPPPHLISRERLIRQFNANNIEELESSCEDKEGASSYSPISATGSSDFPVHHTGSQKGEVLLIDRSGYTYVVGRISVKAPPTGGAQYGARVTTVRATVIENCGIFRIGRHEHNHLAKTGLEAAVTVRSYVKKAALDDVFRPTTALVEDVLLSVLSNKPCQSLPTVINIVRTVNRTRQSVRPHAPLDLNFTLADNFIPTRFLKSDIVHHGRRHLSFATDSSLTILAEAKTWYMDGTHSTSSVNLSNSCTNSTPSFVLVIVVNRCR